MSLIVLSVRTTARPSARRELLHALLDWSAAARSERGALASFVYEDLESPAVFNLVAEREGSGVLEAHIKSDAFGVLVGALELLAGSTRMTITSGVEPSSGDALSAIRRLRARERLGA